MRDQIIGITNDTKYQFSIKNKNQSLAKALGLSPQKILELKRFLTTSTSESDNFNIKEIIQKRKESTKYLDDIITEEIFHHYKHGNLPLNSSILTDITKFSEKIEVAENHFFHIIKKILQEIQESNTFDAKAFPDKNIDKAIKNIKSVINQQINQCEEKNLSALNHTQLRSLQGYAFIYLLYRYPEKSILQEENYIQFMNQWMALQHARQDLHHFLNSPPIRKKFLGNKLGARLQVVEFSDFNKALSKVSLDPTDTTEIIYKHPEKGWCLHNRLAPDAPYALKEIFPVIYTQAQVKKNLKERRDFISQIKDKNNGLIKIEEKKYPMEVKKTSLGLEASQNFSSPQMTLLSGKNSEGKTMALASLVDAAAIKNLEILVIWQHVNATKIQPIHYFNPDSSSSEEILKTRHLLAVSPYEKIILQTGEPKSALDEKEKKSDDNTLEIYQSVSKDLSQIIIKDGNKVTYVKGPSCQALLTNLQEIQLAFPTQKDFKIVIQDLLKVQQITMLCGLTTFHTLKVDSREPYYHSRFDKKQLSLELGGYDLQLMSISQDIKIEVNLFKTFSQPILIKQNQNYCLYGRNEKGNWQITADLNAEAFKDLSFPKSELKPVHSGEYDFHHVIIKDEQPMDMEQIRKYIIPNGSNSLPFIIQKGDEFFIYGQVKYGEWQLSEKLDRRFHLKLDVSEEKQHFPLTMLTERRLFMLPMKTGAGGDCPLHAILGNWDPDSKQIYCQEIAQRRKELKDFLLTQSASPTVQQLIADGVIALIMAGSNAGPHTQSLQKEYQLFSLADDEKHRKNWQKFHDTIKQYPLIVDYIHKNHGLQNSDSFLHQFHSALNAEDSTLAARILSLPDLWAGFQQYNQLQEFDWINRISEDMRKEYIDFVCQPRTWLLPCELTIIAKAFHVSILYYPCAGAKPEILNADEKTTVAVQFDGQNHYDRLDANRYYHPLPQNQAPAGIYKEIDSKKMHCFFSDSQVTTVASEKIPALVYKEIAAKKAHFLIQKFPTILCDVNNNMKQKKREQWSEQYFYLTVDAILRATYQKEYFPWVKTLLGPHLQKYANGKAWTNPSSDIAVIKKYENQILQDLIDFIPNLEGEDNKRVMLYAQTKWQKTLQEIQLELNKESGDSKSSTEDEEELPENEARKFHIKNLRRTEGILEGLLEEKCINPLLPKDSEQSKEYFQEKQLKAKAVWLSCSANERGEIFFSLKDQMRDHLFNMIKTKYFKNIHKALASQADKQSSKQFDHFYLDKDNNFIQIRLKKRINLLLRFTYQFLSSSVLDNFYQDWNWEKLISHIRHEMATSFRHHHPEDSFNDMLTRKTALDQFEKDGYLKKVFRHIEHKVDTHFGDHYSDESLSDMLMRKEKNHHPSPQPALLKPADLCDAYQHDSTQWLSKHLPKNDYLSDWLGFSGETVDFSPLINRLMKSLLSTEIDFSPLRDIREPSTGNTLLHVALLRYRQYYIQEDAKPPKYLLLIIKELFMREACFTALNHEKVSSWHFADLTHFLENQQQDESLSANYDLLLQGFQNLPIETEVSYIVITGLINFLKTSTQQIQSPIQFAAIKRGKIHRLKIVKNVLNEYLKKAHQQNDQVLRAEICKILSEKTFPTGLFSLRHGGDSMLLKIAKQMHVLMKQIAPHGEPICHITICRLAYIMDLEKNIIKPQEGVIYLIPNDDNFTVDAQWINNKSWYYAQFRTREYDLCLMGPKEKDLEFGKLYLKEINGKIAYTVKVSTYKTKTDILTTIPAPKPFNLNNLALRKDDILKASSEAKHTSRAKILSSIIPPWYLGRFKFQAMPESSDSTLESGVLYIKKVNSNNLEYKTLDAEGKAVGGVIEKTQINNKYDILEPFNIDNLNAFSNQVLKITSKNGHTPPPTLTFTNSKDPDIVKQIAALCNCRVTPYYISSPVISFNTALPALMEPETPGYFPNSLALTYTSTLVKKIDEKDIQIQKLEKSLEEKDKEVQELKQQNSNLNKLILDLNAQMKKTEELRQKDKADSEERYKKLQEQMTAQDKRHQEQMTAQDKRHQEQMAAQNRQMQLLMQMVASLSRSTPPPSILPSAGPESRPSNDRISSQESFGDVRFFTSPGPGPASASSQSPSTAPSSSSSSSSSMSSSATSPSSDSTTETTSGPPIRKT